MKHLRKQRTLGRTATQRKALFRTLVSSLLEHGSVMTTRARALELRRHVEPLVTQAKSELTLHRRRTLLSKVKGKEDLERLVEVAGRFTDRPGGYVRVTRLPSQRHDQAEMAQVAFVETDEAPAEKK